MSETLRFSVGIPTLNQAEFLPETIESLLAQTRRPDEIVISDHYSTDRTPEIIADYESRYPGLVRGVRPPPGVKLTGQYNFTLQSQTGDWITLLSSDDVALPNFCETMLQGARRAKDAALVRAAWQNIGADGQIVSRDYLLSVPAVQTSPENLVSQRYGPKVSFAAFAVNRRAFEQSGPILESMESLADWALFVQLAPYGSFVRESAIVSGYRVGHDGNKFRRRTAMWVRDEQRMFSQVFPRAAEELQMKDTAWIAEASRANFRRYIVAASKEFAPEEREELLQVFAPWAESVGEQRLLQEFREGRRLRPSVSIGQAVRHLLRPIAHRVAHAFAAKS